jgi:hypothetical protein
MFLLRSRRAGGARTTRLGTPLACETRYLFILNKAHLDEENGRYRSISSFTNTPRRGLRHINVRYFIATFFAPDIV